MSEQLIFSLQIMKSCSGNTEQDGIYLKWFLAECERRLKAAAKTLDSLADGARPMELTTPDAAAVARAEVRRLSFMIQECADWFKAKPVISRHFTKLLTELTSTINQAERDFTTVIGWF